MEEIQFVVVENVTAECIIVTPFINRFVRKVLPGGKQVLFCDRNSVIILSVPLEVKLKMEGRATPSNKLRMRRGLCIIPIF